LIDGEFGFDSIELLSIGTGRAPYFAKPPASGGGIAWWLGPLIDVVGVSQAQGIHFQSGYILNDRYHRVDFDLPNDRGSSTASTSSTSSSTLALQSAPSILPRFMVSFR
jgi:hypothetical protein